MKSRLSATRAANLPGLQLSFEAKVRLNTLAIAEATDFVELVLITDLDPAFDFVGADLRGIDFGSADLSGFDFTGANLSGCELGSAKCGNAVFQGAIFSEDENKSEMYSSMSEYSQTDEIEEAPRDDTNISEAIDPSLNWENSISEILEWEKIALGPEPNRRAAVDGRTMRPIPISLMNSLMARIDRLGEAKTIVQICAVIGLEVAHPLLERVVLANEPDLDEALADLVASGLLLRQGTGDEEHYVFKHALVRDAAYNSLLRRRRETLHARIAVCLEDHFPETVANKPELLAEHFSEAGLAERAIRFWRRAGERASELSQVVEAQNHFNNGLSLLDDLQDSTVKKELELSLLIGLGPIEIAIGGPGSKTTNDIYEHAVSLCSELPNSPLHFAAHWGQWRTSRTYLIKRDRADKLSTVTAYLGDPGLSMQAHHCQWTTLFNLGVHDACCQHVEKGIELYEAGDYHAHAHIYGGHDPAVCGYGQAALSLWLLGYPDQALVQANRALAVAEEMTHAGSLLHAVEIALMFHRFRQDVDEVERLAERMIELSRREEFAVLEVKGKLFRDWVSGRRGHVEKAIDGLKTDIEALQSIDASEDLPFFLEMLAECCDLGDRAEGGLLVLERAFSEVEKTASRFWSAELLRRKAILFPKAGHYPGAEIRKTFEDALKAARDQKARMLELRTAVSYARWLESVGNPAGASSLLSPIYQSFTEGFDSIDLIAARTCQDELEAHSQKE